MKTVIDELRREHRNFEHVLQLLVAHARLTDIDDPAACRFIMHAIKYLQAFAGGVHNERDAMLLERLQAADPSARGICERLQVLREQLQAVELEMLSRIEGVKAGDSRLCRRVKDLVLEYSRIYTGYLALEEQEAFPAILACVTRSDLQKVNERFASVVDPVFGAQALSRHPTPYDGILAFNTG